LTNNVNLFKYGIYYHADLVAQEQVVDEGRCDRDFDDGHVRREVHVPDAARLDPELDEFRVELRDLKGFIFLKILHFF